MAKVGQASLSCNQVSLKVLYWDLPYSYYSSMTCLFSVTNHCSTDIFADDTTFHINGNTIKEIETKLQCDSLEAHSWSKSNKLPINYDKTTSMTIGSRQRLHNNQTLEINIANNPIVSVNKQKHLGVVIDEHLLI